MAYVMRISGWSSDVCSSDLRLVEVGVADQRTGDDDFLARCRALYGCVLRIGRSRNQGDAHHERRSAQLKLGIMGFLHSAVRSEEHTSELQSLMRISYAVFCLKKKKTQHKATTSVPLRWSLPNK